MALFLFVTILLISVTDGLLWADEICCPGLGCYNNNPPYDGMPLPQCPEDMNMVVKLYTRQNPTNGETISRDTIPSSYKRNALTMFIVHGWTQSEEYQWMHDMKDAALGRGDYNVIIVGWKGGAQNLWYPQPAADTRTVGREVALISNNIINKGYSSKALMYCVGHSLGSHICGEAGQHGQFGRITGLDPAGPMFEDRDWSAGLNPSCADLVDVIHTNGRTLLTFGIGTLKSLGHIDFYPNGGESQPGCGVDPFSKLLGLGDILSLTDSTLTLDVGFKLACSHLRANDYYTESLRTPCFLSRYKCSTADQFPTSCSYSSEAVQSMGVNATAYSGRGIFYLTTNSAAPFCRG